MPGICDGDWKSKIKHVDDGIITIKPHVAGVFTGKHRDSDGDIIGQCREGNVPHIRFVRMDRNGCVYIYEGDIRHVTTGTPHYEIDNGKVNVVCPIGLERNVSPPPGDDWEGEKGT